MTDRDAMTHACDTRTQAIRSLNDHLRTTLTGGKVMITAGVEAMGLPTIVRALRLIRSFAEFTSTNDPYDEHDFGAVTIDGATLFWKIDCYDADLMHGSPDPTDEAVTRRVLTIMLGSEW